MPEPEPIDYKSAGVDLDTYEETMAQLPPLLKRTYTPRVLDWPGGFAGLFRLDDQIGLLSRRYRDPVLVASTDGVGTKLKLAFATGRHATVGIDLVAMSVNDCICAGAEPLIFLDYVAMSRDNPALTREVVKGISDGCVEAECALLGGETAILPEFYQGGEYDLAGLLRRRGRAQAGARRLGDPRRRQGHRPGQLGPALQRLQPGPQDRLRPRRACKPESHVEALGRTVADEFLEPTRIYVRALKTVYRHYRVKRTVHGIAHITGGGLIDNPPRVLPEGLAIRLRRGSWDVPPVFPWLQAQGNVPDDEMFRVFNMGIGLVLIVADYYADAIARYLRTEVNVPVLGHRRGDRGRQERGLGVTTDGHVPESPAISALWRNTMRWSGTADSARMTGFELLDGLIVEKLPRDFRHIAVNHRLFLRLLERPPSRGKSIPETRSTFPTGRCGNAPSRLEPDVTIVRGDERKFADHFPSRKT